jgi:uridine kinase
MTKHIETQLQESTVDIRWGLLDTRINDKIPDAVTVLPPKNQIKGIHTILRNHSTPRDEFVFYADRLSVLLMET